MGKSKKKNRFNKKNNNSLSASRFFANVFAVPAQKTTWNDQLLSLLENGNGKVINITSSVWTWTRPPHFSSNLISYHLTNKVN